MDQAVTWIGHREVRRSGLSESEPSRPMSWLRWWRSPKTKMTWHGGPSNYTDNLRCLKATRPLVERRPLEA